MTPAKIEINETNQAAVSSRRGHINLPGLLKINDAKGKHLDNELYNDRCWAEFSVKKLKISDFPHPPTPGRNANISGEESKGKKRLGRE